MAMSGHGQAARNGVVYHQAMPREKMGPEIMSITLPRDFGGALARRASFLTRVPGDLLGGALRGCTWRSATIWPLPVLETHTLRY